LEDLPEKTVDCELGLSGKWGPDFLRPDFPLLCGMGCLWERLDWQLSLGVRRWRKC